MKDAIPKVSIVIPVYNGSNYLMEAIDSALGQNYENIEVIVINDGSTDDGASRNVAKAYGDRIQYYEKPNGGVATALNLGIEKMTGDFFSWLSHDDMYVPTKVAKQVARWKAENDENTIVASNVSVLFEEGVTKKEFVDINTFAYIDIFLATSAITGLNGCSLLVPRSVFQKAGGFRSDLPVTQDYDMWFRLIGSYKFVLLRDHLVISRRHQDQDSVRMHDRMRQDGDKLHASFLTRISQERFNTYYSESRRNQSYIYKNYLTFRSRGYSHTAARILMTLLNYYYKTDRKRFRSFYDKEVGRRRSLSDGASSMSLEALDIEINMFEKRLKNEYMIRSDRARATKKVRVIGLANRIAADGLLVTLKRVIKKRYR